MSDETDIFLEHFGVRGMHWGVRNKRVDKKSWDKFKKDVKEDNPLHIGKIKIRPTTIATTAVIGGAGLVSTLLAIHKNSKIRDINKKLDALDASKKILDENRSLKMSQITRVLNRGKINRERAMRIRGAVDTKYRRDLVKTAIKEGVNPVHRFGDFILKNNKKLP